MSAPGPLPVVWTETALAHLAAMYRDLRAGLLKWERGEAGEALWEWRFGFENHWGKHATGALRALWARAAWHDENWPRIDEAAA